MNLIIDKTKKLGIPAENTTREIILWIRAKYEIEIWDGENSLPSTEINSNVQIRNMQRIVELVNLEWTLNRNWITLQLQW